MDASQDAYARLETTVALAVPMLLALSDERTRAPRAPGKWCAREELGHLIDSASNNHGRFVRAALGGDLVFPVYHQDEWVALQRYAEAPWPDLVALWAAFNRHIARVMTAIPDEARRRVRLWHNLHEIGWRELPAGEPATLSWFMDDYVGHLHHHLARILGPSWDRAAS